MITFNFAYNVFTLFQLCFLIHKNVIEGAEFYLSPQRLIALLNRIEGHASS